MSEPIEDRFKVLSRKCQKIRIENRKFLEELVKPKVYSVKDTETTELDIDEDIDDKDKVMLLRLLNKPLRQFENEEIKKERLHSYTHSSGDAIAQATYHKELSSLNKKSKETSDTKRDKLDLLADNLNTRAKERYAIKKKQLNKFKNSNTQNFGAYINDKNRKFNEQLDKQDL